MKNLELVSQFLRDPASGVRTDQSRKTYRQVLVRALAEIGKPAGQVVEADLVDWLDRDLATKTIATYRGVLMSFFSWAAWKGLIGDDPSQHLRRAVRVKVKPVKEHHWLEPEQVEAVFDSIDTATFQGARDLLLLRLGFTVGLRTEEIAHVKWSDWDGASRLKVVGKGEKLAEVHLPPRTVDAFSRHEQNATQGAVWVFPPMRVTRDWTQGLTEAVIDWDSHLAPRTIYGIVRERTEIALGAPISPHDMRRTFASMMHDKGVGIEVVSKAMRHEEIGTTQRYLERRQDSAALAAAGVLDL